ncbi:hypothetical protein HNR42_001947 [Deinobacterium chartae]|uniref:Uncharacterized protein n=1 Tax=Deinobacterium chartae TaxID=521158 RepID=A0A841HZZ3_9DEIO|nr:hypothetical protein [Deinobacterium chartae]MBB6098513.1 hypothetical protein [Deinobacterium chartae]
MKADLNIDRIHPDDARDIASAAVDVWNAFRGRPVENPHQAEALHELFAALRAAIGAQQPGAQRVVSE